jgi:Major Facilitator Superfamily
VVSVTRPATFTTVYQATPPHASPSCPCSPPPATPGSGIAAETAFAATMAIFTLGECLLSPTLPAVINDLAPPGAVGRYNGARHLAFTTGFLLGPTGRAALGAGWGASLFAVLAAVCAAAAAAALPGPSPASRRQPHPPPAPSSSNPTAATSPLPSPEPPTGHVDQPEIPEDEPDGVCQTVTVRSGRLQQVRLVAAGSSTQPGASRGRL